MKNWLFSINTILIFSSILTCNGMPKNSADTKSSTPQDSSVTAMDSIMADSIVHLADSLSKEEKYSNHEGGGNEAPKHDAPNQAKIDSIKAAKAKKKKG
ncbi:MAG: hypothetical protein SH808_01225 [Saprospiraceae bacterium]|nr:hypothetical protein [Saprospiraceae bacterium]